VTTDNLPALHDHCHQISDTMGEWANGGDADILPARPAKDAQIA
jgi:hypothetical protein